MAHTTKEKLIVLIGPTAVGKTKTSIHLAKSFNAEIISGDSMQIYKGMDIGTAKITIEEMEGVPHHLIDIKDPKESFSAAEFQQLVREKISEIHSRGKIPMIVGGTGLYIQSVIYDYQFTDSPGDAEYRCTLEERVKDEGIGPLYDELQRIDPSAAKNIHPNNTRRVIRALEIFHCTGETMTDYQSSQIDDPLYETALLGLTMDRDKLYDRINKRVDIMVEEGLIEEVQTLYNQGVHNVQSVQAIGYKEIYEYLEGRISFDRAIETLKQNSRRYAKRQLTWFRNKMDVTWFDMTPEEDHDKIISGISEFIAGKLELKSN
ncbi:tRNA (adenosine(37)-N6)-dimethylallyltransferase MiaA [[Bacillus] enclensis]|uniref:tRNA (adenosine(37)-N6)-dimethylallyltransferase MiaA n=1 Tax=[Bacillus] enclensis TaxID=1402860 RepID=UPI0018DBFE3E|nr:tRNA (adenosine(37)-N6)-dimethylallyltransferase MiaA [[Bacillus] enclensis]MBH9965351.1 tRNA (adenosine(37)-N6)-dimethylallyltransferase MiaA [[Bacillus] enclensis]